MSVQVEQNVDLNTGEINFFLQINITRDGNIINRGLNEKAVFEKKDTETNVKAGSIRLQDRPAAKPGRNAA